MKSPSEPFTFFFVPIQGFQLQREIKFTRNPTNIHVGRIREAVESDVGVLSFSSKVVSRQHCIIQVSALAYAM